MKALLKSCKNSKLLEKEAWEELATELEANYTSGELLAIVQRSLKPYKKAKASVWVEKQVDNLFYTHRQFHPDEDLSEYCYSSYRREIGARRRATILRKLEQEYNVKLNPEWVGHLTDGLTYRDMDLIARVWKLVYDPNRPVGSSKQKVSLEHLIKEIRINRKAVYLPPSYVVRTIQDCGIVHNYGPTFTKGARLLKLLFRRSWMVAHHRLVTRFGGLSFKTRLLTMCKLVEMTRDELSDITSEEFWLVVASVRGQKLYHIVRNPEWGCDIDDELPKRVATYLGAQNSEFWVNLFRLDREMTLSSKMRDINHLYTLTDYWTAAVLLQYFPKNYTTVIDMVGVDSLHDTLWMVNPQDRLEGLAEAMIRDCFQSVSYYSKVISSWTTFSQDDIRMLSFRELNGLLEEKAARDFCKTEIGRLCYEFHGIDTGKLGKAIRFYQQGLETQTIFHIPVSVWYGKYQGYFLTRDDPRGIFLGGFTNCCQGLGSAGESCMIHGQTNPDGGFFVIEKAGRIVCQSWVWYHAPTKTVCFDNIEALGDREDDFLGLYKEISSILQDFIPVSKVTVGTGYCDLRLGELSSTESAPSPIGCYSDARKQKLLWHK